MIMNTAYSIFKSTAGAVVTGVAIVAIFLFGMVQYEDFQAQQKVTRYMTMPVTHIFQADVFVPDFIVGEDPLITYESTKFQTFSGDFDVEIKNSNGMPICRGQGRNITYTPDDTVPSDATLSWFMWNQHPPDCAVERLHPGRYFLDVTYTIRVEGYPIRYYRIKSNVFNVENKQGEIVEND